MPPPVSPPYNHPQRRPLPSPADDPEPTPMSDTHLRRTLQAQTDDLRAKGLYKTERRLEGPQGSAIRVGGREVLNFCANNYLGLASHPTLIAAAHEGLDRYGYGLASVRFICGTQELHKRLETAVARFLGKEDAI